MLGGFTLKGSLPQLIPVNSNKLAQILPSQGSLSTCPWHQLGAQSSKVEANLVPKEQNLIFIPFQFWEIKGGKQNPLQS